MARAFEVVQDDRPDPADSPAEGGPRIPTKNVAQAALISSLMLALKAVSQRAFIALLDCFALITAGAAFWLFYSFDNPTVFQIVHATIFAVFTLVINWIVRQQR